MSPKSKTIMFWMIKELSKLPYAYRSTVEGCFDCAVEKYGFENPEDSKDVIIDEVIQILNIEVNKVRL